MKIETLVIAGGALLSSEVAKAFGLNELSYMVPSIMGSCIAVMWRVRLHKDNMRRNPLYAAFEIIWALIAGTAVGYWIGAKGIGSVVHMETSGALFFGLAGAQIAEAISDGGGRNLAEVIIEKIGKVLGK